MNTVKISMNMVLRWILEAIREWPATDRDRTCSLPLTGWEVKVDAAGIKDRAVGSDEEHWCCVKPRYHTISIAASHNIDFTYPLRHAPIVCVRQPRVSRIPQARQIRNGAIPQVQINCQRTDGHHSHPRPKSMICSGRDSPVISEPGTPHPGWYFAHAAQYRR